MGCGNVGPTERARIDAARMVLEFNRRVKLQEYQEALVVAEKILELEPGQAVIARFRDVLRDKVHLDSAPASILSQSNVSTCTSSGEDDSSSSEDENSSTSSASEVSSDNESISDPDSGAATSEDDDALGGADWEWVPGLSPEDLVAAQQEGETRRRNMSSHAKADELQPK